jgi:predicted ATPase with chaperone activity
MPGESKNSPREIQNYLGRISGPLLDRIDLHIEVPPVKFREIAGDRTGETSAQIRQRVVAARQRQHARFADKPKITCNARIGAFDYYTVLQKMARMKWLCQFRHRQLRSFRTPLRRFCGGHQWAKSANGHTRNGLRQGCPRRKAGSL